MFVCHCNAVSDRTVDAAIASGASTVDEITERCSAGGGCGGCHRMLESLLEATAANLDTAAVAAA